jgi:hypothetical protein
MKRKKYIIMNKMKTARNIIDKEKGNLTNENNIK